MELINDKIFDSSLIEKLKQEFKTNKPYPHIIIDNFLKEEAANKIFADFPKDETFNKHYKGLNEFKSEGSNFEDFPAIFSDLKKEFHSSEFCSFLEKVTGIKDVYSVEDGLGAGLHQGINGSYLDIHIDFNIHYDRDIHRRLNLLLYLNKDWKDEWGGHLEMWDKDMTKCEKYVFPAFNRCVVFETSEISYHGYSKINVPQGISRKSFYSYYYTDLREDAKKYHDTIFKARPNEGTLKKVKTDVKESLKNNIKSVFKRLGIKI